VIVAGVDIGSRTAKTVIMDEKGIISSAICDTIMKGKELALITLDKALAGTGLSLNDIQYTVTTGYGRFVVPYADKNISEISCHVKGIRWYFPSVRTVLDIGGQDSKAINCDEQSRITKFVLNDKCAGGTGRFLEVMAEVLQVPFVELGKLSLESSRSINFSTTCVIFAKSEALSLLKQGENKGDIARGLNDTVARMGFNLLRRISIEKDISITGGVAKNIGVVEKIKEMVGLELIVAPDPQLIGALGAALFAKERAGTMVKG